MINPFALAVTTILLPYLIAIMAHGIARIPPFGNLIAKWICVATSYISLLLIMILTNYVIEKGPITGSILLFSKPFGTISFSLYVDCLALIPTLLSALFASLAQTFAVEYLSLNNRYRSLPSTFNRAYSFMLIFLGAMTGACFLGNMIMIIIFWEISSICSYVLVSFWQEDPVCINAALKTLIITHIGTISFLIGSIVIYPVVGTWEIHEWAYRLSANLSVPMAMLLFFIGILPKAVQFPLHSWLPDATVAPTPVTAYVHVVGFLMGLYAFPRFFGQIFATVINTSFLLPEPISWIFGRMNIWSFLISITGAITLIIAPIFGLLESESKRLIAYCLISSLGSTVMALGFVSSLGTTAGLFAMISHVFYCGLLFFAIGVGIYRIGRTSIYDMGGLYNYMPITSICGAIGVLSLASFPFLGYFTALWLTIHSALELNAPFFIVSTFLGSILKTAAILRLFHAMFLGKSLPYGREIKEAPKLMLFPIIFLSILLFFIGVFPQFLFEVLIFPSIDQLGMEVRLTAATNDIIMASGFWSPALGAAVILIYLCMIVIVIYTPSRGIVIPRTHIKMDERVKPFLCGEDLNLLEHLSGYHLFYALTDIVKIDKTRNNVDIDRLYYLISKKLSIFCEKMIHLDIKQQYFPAILLFMIGATILILISFILG